MSLGAFQSDRSLDPDRPESPRISVVVTAYRRRTYLEEAFRSVLQQTLDPSEYEIIVIKDFPLPSIDNLVPDGGPRVRIVTAELPRVGQMLARGIAETEGDIVCFLDDDDRYHEGKLAAVLDRFRADPDLAFYHHWFAPIDALGQPYPSWRPALPTPASVPVGRAVPERVFAAFEHASGHGNLSCIGVRRDVVVPHLDLLSRITSSTDYALLACGLASSGVLRSETAVLSDYRVHPSTTRLADPATLIRRANEDCASFAVMRQICRGSRADRYVSSLAANAAIERYLVDPTSAPPELPVYFWTFMAARFYPTPWAFVRWVWAVARRLAPVRANRAYVARKQILTVRTQAPRRGR